MNTPSVAGEVLAAAVDGGLPPPVLLVPAYTPEAAGERSRLLLASPRSAAAAGLTFTSSASLHAAGLLLPLRMRVAAVSSEDLCS